MPDLIVDLKTDYAPLDDFARVEVTVARSRTGERKRVQYSVHTVERSAGADYRAGVRIAEFTELTSDRPHVLMAKLLDSRGRTVDHSVVRVDLRDRALGITVLISR